MKEQVTALFFWRAEEGASGRQMECARNAAGLPHVHRAEHENTVAFFCNNSMTASWSEGSWIMAHDVKDTGRAQHGMSELRGSELSTGLKGWMTQDRLLRWELAWFYKLVRTMSNSNSVWFGPGRERERALLSLLYLSSISISPALPARVKTNCARPAVPASADSRDVH